MIKYVLCEGTTEIRVGNKLTSYTSDELIRSFWSEDVIDYNDVAEFNTLEEAQAAFGTFTPAYRPSAFKNQIGLWCLEYSVVFIQSREYDDDGDEIERIDEIACKTDGDFKVHVYRVRQTTPDGARCVYDDVYERRSEAESVADEYRFNDEYDGGEDDPPVYGNVYDIIEEEA